MANKIVGNDIKNSVKLYSEANIPAQDIKPFQQSVIEELEEISPQRIIGMGISTADLNKWLILASTSTGS